MTLETLNTASQEAFTKTLGWLFEHSPWVAERAWHRRPFQSPESLLAALCGEVARASRDEQLTLIRAHPDLGARAKMSDASVSEQSGAGLDRLDPEEYELLQRLNAGYRAKFGIPFLLAVKGNTKHDVLNALSYRIHASADEEFTTALAQICRIASFRLDTVLAA